MKRRNLLTTIMAAVMAVVMINTAAGCGETSGQTTAPAASSQSASKSESGTAQKSEAKSRTNNVPSSAAAKAASTDKNSSENIQKTTSFKLYIISKDGVNVRQKPSTSADSLGLGDYGSSYTCEGFCKFRFHGNGRLWGFLYLQRICDGFRRILLVSDQLSGSDWVCGNCICIKE